MKSENSEKVHMMKFGSQPAEMRKMSVGDIFLSQLKLLIIMVKAQLRGCPLGKFREQAVINNANYILDRSLPMLDTSTLRDGEPVSIQKIIPADDAFRDGVQRLAVLAKEMVNDCSMDFSRKNMLSDTLLNICKTIDFKYYIDDVKFLRVA